MAKFNNGNLSGLIGPVVACTLGGKTYLRSRPERSNKPASPAQRAQRTSLGMVRLFVTPFRPVLQLGFAEASSEGNAHNIGIKRNFRRILQGEHPAVSSTTARPPGSAAAVTAVTFANRP
ncbi:MAG TPA: DUF6266 family protein, partial [Chitinophagaceae bacterium]